MQNRPARHYELSLEEFEALIVEHEQLETELKAEVLPVIEAATAELNAAIETAETEEAKSAAAEAVSAKYQPQINAAIAKDDAKHPGLHDAVHHELEEHCGQAQQQYIAKKFGMFAAQFKAAVNDSGSDNDMDFSPSMGRM